MAASASFGTRLAARLIRRSQTTATHQAIAFDAIACLSSPNANAWQRMFLKQAQLFALGAAAPDAEFRDYKNHVVFPRDGYWGGAIPKAQSWYLNLTTALAKREWQNAAYCAGVLNHYVIDALHPLHTAQSEAENDIHYALDVTVWTTYATLARQGTTLKSSPVALSAEPGFLALALCAGAERANQNYEKLLAHFDMARAVTDPAMGLDIIGRQVMAGVIADATQMLAAIFDRAIADAGTEASQVPLVGASLTAALGLPLAAMANARRTRTSLRQIVLMFDELVATGRVTKHLPDEERAKRDLYAKEILGARVKSNVDNVFPFVPNSKVSTPATVPAAEGDEDTGGEVIVLTRNRVKMEPVRPAPRRVEEIGRAHV